MMDVTDLVRMGFVPAPEEPPLGSRETSAGFYELDAAFAASRMEPPVRMHFRSGIQANAGHLGEYVLPLAHLLVPAFTYIVVTWLKGRAGRKVRLKLGDVRIEAATAKDVAMLVEKARELQTAKSRTPAKGKGST